MQRLPCLVAEFFAAPCFAACVFACKTWVVPQVGLPHSPSLSLEHPSQHKIHAVVANQLDVVKGGVVWRNQLPLLVHFLLMHMVMKVTLSVGGVSR